MAGFFQHDLSVYLRSQLVLRPRFHRYDLHCGPFSTGDAEGIGKNRGSRPPTFPPRTTSSRPICFVSVAFSARRTATLCPKPSGASPHPVLRRPLPAARPSRLFQPSRLQWPSRRLVSRLPRLMRPTGRLSTVGVPSGTASLRRRFGSRPSVTLMAAGACFWAAWTTPWTTIGATGTRFASDLTRFMLSSCFVFFAGGRPRQAEAPPSQPRGQFSDAEKACSAK